MQYFDDTGGALWMSRHLRKQKSLAVFCALREKTHDWLHCKRNDVLPTICLDSSVELLRKQRYEWYEMSIVLYIPRQILGRSMLVYRNYFQVIL